MAFSEADLLVAQARFNRIPLERFYPALGMQVEGRDSNGNIAVTRGRDAYSTTPGDLRTRVEQEILQDHLGGKMGRQVVGGLSVLEHIELQVKAEREAAEAAA